MIVKDNCLHDAVHRVAEGREEKVVHDHPGQQLVDTRPLGGGVGEERQAGRLHLPGIRTVPGDGLVEDLHLLLVQVGHHQLQLLLRPPGCLPRTGEVLLPAIPPPGPVVHGEEVPAVPVDRAQGVGWAGRAVRKGNDRGREDREDRGRGRENSDKGR